MFHTSRKTIAFMVVVSLYALNVNVNMTRRAHLIEEERRLSIDLGDGACILTAASKETVEEGTTKTILASFPGSGKKFTYAVIEGLTDQKAGDDWNFSKLGADSMHLKTSYPHREGTWSWSDQFDQVILLIRNPRWTLPSYHTMRFELDYSSNWAESYIRIPFVYTERPDVATWKGWRDLHFDEELDNWVNYIEFWMEGGVFPDGSQDPHCTSDLDCNPKGVIDFDRFYQEHPTTEFYKLNTILGQNGSKVEMIASEARSCILDAVFDKKELHNARRNGFGPPQSSKTFTTDQLKEMLNRISELRGKYAVAPYTESPIAIELVKILDEYNNQIGAEFEFQADQTETV